MLPRSQRLHTAADFRRVRARGREWRSPSFLAYIVSKPVSTPRLGVIVSAKIGKAVVRKRASRVLRAAFAQVAAELGNTEIVLIGRPVVKGKTSPEVAEELRRMISQGRR